MSCFKFLIICCLIYQTLAGTPSFPSHACVTCTDVLVNLAPPSRYTCDPVDGDAAEIFVSYTPEAGLPDTNGVCVNPVSVTTNPSIREFNLVL